MLSYSVVGRDSTSLSTHEPAGAAVGANVAQRLARLHLRDVVGALLVAAAGERALHDAAQRVQQHDDQRFARSPAATPSGFARSSCAGDVLSSGCSRPDGGSNAA